MTKWDLSQEYKDGWTYENQCYIAHYQNEGGVGEWWERKVQGKKSLPDILFQENRLLYY